MTALPVGERKSAAVELATAPIHCLELARNANLRPAIQQYQHHRSLLETRLKSAKTKASKSKDLGQRQRLEAEARDIVAEMSEMSAVHECRLICDDETPEHLSKLLAEQNGRMLQASAEGTLFEMVKGRYSEHSNCNFDVYLKGHSGDYLCTGRIGREGEKIQHPALSIALAVQPDVIAGLAARASLGARGFLARFLFSLPLSRLGNRDVDPPAMKAAIQENYNSRMSMLWRAGSSDNVYSPQQIKFSAAAREALSAFRAWIEPHLAPKGEFSNLNGWGTKLGGACVRIAAILHCCQLVEQEQSPGDADAEVDVTTVERAVHLCREYLLPHTEAAMLLMGTDPIHEKALRVVELLQVWQKKTIKRRDIHRATGRLFEKADEMDPILDLLVQYAYLRPCFSLLQAPGRGHKSPEYEINPRIPGEEE